jgi:hypothetical protein
MPTHPDHTYRVTEVVGTSTDSVQQAVRNGVSRAGEVTEIRGWINDGEVGHFQVTMKIGFRLDD